VVSANRFASAIRDRVPRAVALSIAVAALGVFAAQGAGATSLGRQQASASAANPGVMALSGKAAGAFQQTKTIERVNLINGQNVVVDKRTVTLSVNVTKNLINRQEIGVSWSGAHPTGGIGANPNNPVAEYQEYPMVLLECHGNPSPKAPAAQQIQPQDCYTATPQERVFSGEDAWPAWRLDRYATAAGQRNLNVGVPNPVPKGCFIFNGIANYWLNYVTPGGRDYPIGPGECAGAPNEMSLLGGVGILPDNETFAVTNTRGKGATQFDVWTSETNLDLGCSQTVSCSLVAVPIMGISCDPAAASMPPADQPGADEQQAAAECEQTGFFAPGAPAPTGESGASGDQQLAVTGELWWAASNWRNRFVVPLTFAPPSNVCSIVNQNNHVIQMYGSELMDQAMLQWQPHFCVNKKLFTVQYIPNSEPASLSEMESLPPGAPGSVEASLASNQQVTDQATATFQEPVVHAPVAATGYAISFVIDNAAGLPVTTLRLDPRLLAKLLTESYTAGVATDDPELAPDADQSGSTCKGTPVATTLTAAINATQPSITVASDSGFPAAPFNVTIGSEELTVTAVSGTGDTTWTVVRGVSNTTAAAAANGVTVTYFHPTVSNNPVNITYDPEFQALNPGIPEENAQIYTASIMLALSSNSDLTWALTSYINSNPAARAWLNGTPDPWGMVVNCEYKGITLPRLDWPLLSTYVQPSWQADNSGPGYCYSIDPTPVLPLIAAPVPDLFDLAEDIQFYQSQAQVLCAGDVNIPASLHLAAQGQETVGHRFMIGLTTLADAERYGLGVASLLTYTKPGTPAKFTSDSGMTFTAPTTASLRTAAALLRPDKATHEWDFPYSLYNKDSTKVADAYPGTMLVYADVPTKGLPKSDKKEVDAQDYATFIKFAATTGQKPGGGVGQLPPGYLPMTVANHLSAEASYAYRAASAITAQKGAVPALIPPKKAKSSATPSPSTTGSTSTTGSGTSATSSAAPSSTTSTKSASPSSPSSRARIALTPEANFGVVGYVLPAVGGLAVLAAVGAAAFFWMTRVKGKKWG